MKETIKLSTQDKYFYQCVNKARKKYPDDYSKFRNYVDILLSKKKFV